MPRAYFFPTRGEVTCIEVPHDEDEMFASLPQPLRDRPFLTGVDCLELHNRYLIIDDWHERAGKRLYLANGITFPSLPLNKTIAPYFPNHPILGDAVLVAVRPEEDSEGGPVEGHGVVDVDLPEKGSKLDKDSGRISSEEILDDFRAYEEAMDRAAKAATRLRMAKVLSGLVAIP